MANRYWVGGTGTWNTSSTTNWSTTSGGSSGASVPTTNDLVFFDQAGTYTVTLTGSLTCSSLTVSAGTVTVAQGSAPFLNISGSMTLASSTVWSATVTITFSSTTTGNTITTNGVTMPGQFTFNGVGGGWTLGSALTNTAGSFLLTAGALNLGGYTLTCAIFSSTGTGVRSISFGSTNIVLTATLSMAIATNFSCTTSGGGFSANATGAKTHVFGTTGGTALNAPNLTFSGTGSSTITLTNFSKFNTLDFGTTTGGTNTTTLGLTNLILGSGTYTGLTPAFNTGYSCTINGNSKTIPNLTIALGAGSLTLAGNLTVSGTTTLTSGTLDLGGYTLTTPLFSSDNLNTRSISFGTSNIVLTNSANSSNLLSMSQLDNLTIPDSSGGFSIALVNVASIIRNISVGFTSGVTEFNLPNIIFTGTGAASSGFSFSGGYCNKFDCSAASGNLSTSAQTIYCKSFALGSTANVSNLSFSTIFTGTISGEGSSPPAALDIGGTTILNGNVTITGSTDLNAGSLGLAGFTLTTSSFFCIGVSGGGSSTATGLTFGSGTINLTIAGGSALDISSSVLTITSTTGGFTADANYSRSFRCTIFFVLSLRFTGTGSAAQTFTSNSFNKLDFGTTTFNPGTIVLYPKSLTLGGGTYTGLTVQTSGAGVLNGNGKTIAALTIANGTGITTTLAAAITVPTVTFSLGTLDLAGFTLTATTSAVTDTGTKNITFNGGSLVCSAASATAWNNAAPTGFTTTAGTGTGTINMTAATAKTFVGGGSTYNCTLNQGGAGALTVTGSNTFSNMTNTVQPASVLFTAGTTNSFTQFNLNGTAGNLITLGSVTAATHTLATLSNIVNVNYLSISYSVATGTNTWYANTTSTNVSNNTGWVFGPPVGGQFAAFFS